MFTQLPPEIIHQVVESVNLLQRARIMMTCRYFRQVLEPTLYRHLSLLDPELYSRSGRLHQTLCDRPALISQVVTYHGPVCPSKDPGRSENFFWDRTIFDEPRWSVGLNFFQKAVNIRDLYFTDHFNQWIGDPTFAHHKEAVKHMVLDRLVIQVPDESGGVVQVLRHQSELTRLELPWGGGVWNDLEATDIPKLKSLTATLETAAFIVPGRPVDEVNLLPSQGARWLNEDLLQNLSESTRSIRKFEMKLDNPLDDDSVRGALQALARHLPAIEDLTIT
ncbi:hypothetical protein FRC01_011997, partial [Tulasnella sp. 417]